MTLNRISRLGLAALAALAAPATGRAQDATPNYPVRPIHIVVGFAAGGGNDILARLFGQKLSEDLNQPVIIENKPGASAELAADYVRNAAPDGYTLMVAANGSMTVSPAINRRLPYVPLRDFTYIGMVASFPLVVVVNPASPIHSLADLVRYTKDNPDKANYSEPSVAFQVVVEQFKLKTGAPLQLIPYKSSTEALTAVIAGTTLTTLVDAGPVAGALKGGQVRGLAITSAQRAAEFPDVPTMAEAGFPDLAVSFWSGLFGPAGIPAPITRKLEAELIRITRLPDVQERMRALAVVPEGRPGADLRAVVTAEIARVADIVRIANIKSE